MNRHQFSVGWSGLLALSLGAQILAGCEDPAAGKPKADVASARPVSSAPAGDKVSKLTIDGTTSKVQWVGSKVTGKHEGGFKKVSGTIEIDESKETGKVTADIDVSSLYSDADKLTEHLLSDDFFEVKKYPTAKFVSTEIKKGGEGGASHTVTGNLTLHGKTKSITFPATIELSDKALTVKSEFAINRKDFEMVYAGKPDDLIRDDVVIKLALNVPRS